MIYIAFHALDPCDAYYKPVFLADRLHCECTLLEEYIEHGTYAEFVLRHPAFLL